MEPEIVVIIEAAIEDWKRRAPRYSLYARYYAGLHAFTFATNKYHSAFARVFREFRSNLCPAVVDALSDRLTITGFTLEENTLDDVLAGRISDATQTSDDETATDDAERLAMAIWKYNRMDQRSDELHGEMAQMGDAYVTVWTHPDNEQVPVIYPQKAATTTVRYDSEKPGIINWAAKHWVGTDGFLRVTVYLPDRIERFISLKKARINPEQQTFVMPGIKDLVPLVDDLGPAVIAHDFGMVPVFHFPNNARMGDFGKSELEDAIPIQDALNKSIIDRMVASEFIAYPQRYITGLDVSYDDNGQPLPFRMEMGADRILGLAEGQNAGQFPAGDLTGMIADADSHRMDMARVTATPLHYLQPMGNPPSGEALKTMEARFVKKVLKAQATVGNIWEDVMELAFQIMGETVALEAQWEAAAQQSELEHLQSLVLEQTLGVPKAMIWRKIGYSATEIDDMEEMAAEQQQAAIETAQAAFNSGAASGFGQNAATRFGRGGSNGNTPGTTNAP